jgi:hypothetical protein
MGPGLRLRAGPGLFFSTLFVRYVLVLGVLGSWVCVIEPHPRPPKLRTRRPNMRLTERLKQAGEKVTQTLTSDHTRQEERVGGGQQPASWFLSTMINLLTILASMVVLSLLSSLVGAAWALVITFTGLAFMFRHTDKTGKTFGHICSDYFEGMVEKVYLGIQEKKEEKRAEAL